MKFGNERIDLEMSLGIGHLCPQKSHKRIVKGLAVKVSTPFPCGIGFFLARDFVGAMTEELPVPLFPPAPYSGH